MLRMDGTRKMFGNEKDSTKRKGKKFKAFNLYTAE